MKEKGFYKWEDEIYQEIHSEWTESGDENGALSYSSAGNQTAAGGRRCCAGLYFFSSLCWKTLEDLLHLDFTSPSHPNWNRLERNLMGGTETGTTTPWRYVKH